MKRLDIETIRAITYFSMFDYAPIFDEVYTFCRAKTSRKGLKTSLSDLERRNKIKVIGSPYRYTVGEYSIKTQNNKFQISNDKLNNFKFRAYIKLISLFPQIKLIGLSGSISMFNAKKDDDIDLFIITSKNRLFTGRFICLFFAQLLGLRRFRDSETPFLSHDSLSLPALGGRAPLESEKNAFSSSLIRDKVCLNLFFDERELLIPKHKKTEFVAHEVLQMKPIINKNKVYEQFLASNKWVFKIFPNTKSKIQISNIKSNPKSKARGFKLKILSFFCHLDFVIWILNKKEALLKDLQLKLINKHKTTEIITNTQLWFHPDDFEKKIKT